MAVLHQGMTIHLSSLFSLDRYSLFVILHFFCLFICQSSICFGMGMIVRYDQSELAVNVCNLDMKMWKMRSFLNIYPDIKKKTIWKLQFCFSITVFSLSKALFRACAFLRKNSLAHLYVPSLHKLDSIYLSIESIHSYESPWIKIYLSSTTSFLFESEGTNCILL